MLLKAAEISPQQLYKILIGSIMPRPIAWVSTLSASGQANLAPFSFFTVASVNPPIICFAPLFAVADANGKGIAKDTLRNIDETGEFVVNFVGEDIVRKMHQTSAPYPSDVSEFDAVGLTPLPSEMISPPRVAESVVNMECKLHQIVRLGDEQLAGSLIIGQILCIHFAENVYKDEHVDIDLLKPVGRMAGTSYSTVKDRFELPRPVV